MSKLVQSRLRLASGLVLFIFVLGHFANHSLGIVSLAAMNNALYYTVDPWRTAPGTVLLSGSILVHASLAVWAVYSRTGFRMKGWEVFQLLSGFLIPVMMSAHILSARGYYEAFGLEQGYAYQLYVQWIGAPYRSFMVFAGLFFVWTHACIGWHYWLRYKAWYVRHQIWFFAFALLFPTLAAVGVLSAGFRVLRLSRSERWTDRLLADTRELGDAPLDFLLRYEFLMLVGVAAVIAILMLIHLARWYVRNRKRGMRIEYRDIEKGHWRQFKVSDDMTLLDNLRDNDIAHASVCGGRGRCSTCRVKVERGGEALSEASTAEKRILEKIEAPDSIRLACQIRPVDDLAVTALLHPGASAREALSQMRSRSGEEQDIAILFADIRAFTRMSETQLPFDTAFLLNRYFAAMGRAIEDAGGHLDKFIGDGVMALFGVDEDLETGAKRAIRAATAMSESLDGLNETLKDQLSEPLRIGIGIHCGTAIIGNMGYKHASGLTAIGDVVNTASRLESMTKEFGVQLVVSAKTLEQAGFDPTESDLVHVQIRGRQTPLPVCKFGSAKLLQMPMPESSDKTMKNTPKRAMID